MSKRTQQRRDLNEQVTGWSWKQWLLQIEIGAFTSSTLMLPFP
jgi:hypothetical protein